MTDKSKDMKDWEIPNHLSHLTSQELVNHLGFLLDAKNKALAVFADQKSWMKNHPYTCKFVWNKVGDFGDPREFAREALEGNWLP